MPGNIIFLIFMFLIFSPRAFVFAQGSEFSCQFIFGFQQRSLMPALVKSDSTDSALNVEIFPENTSARVFVEMAQRNMLLNQTSAELGAKGLLVPNGGLCASTCLTNILGAMTAQEGNFRAFPRVAPVMTDLVVKAYQQFTGVDARFGADVRVLAEVVTSILPEIVSLSQFDSTFSNLQLSVGRYQEGLYPHLLFQKLKGDTIAVVSVRAENPAEFGTALGHALIVLKVDPSRQVLFISDPNRPNKIIETPYFYTEGTNIAFYVPETFGQHRVQLFQVNTFTRVIYNFN